MEMQTYGEGYKGAGNIRVEIAYTKDKEHALIKVAGVNHEWDQKVQRLDVSSMGNGSYDLTIPAAEGEKPTNVIVNRSSGTLYNNTMQLFLPGYDRNPINLKLDDELTAAVQPLHLNTEYQQSVSTN